MESVHEMVLVVDFGGQYNQLIARRVRDCHVYCEVVPYNKALDAVKEKKPKGIIFTGGPNSVYAEGAPQIDPAIFEKVQRTTWSWCKKNTIPSGYDR